MDSAPVSNMSRYELQNTEDDRIRLGYDPKRAPTSDMAMEFDEEDDEAGESMRDGQRSYFSSRVHSSSDTFNSEIRAM